MHLPQRAIDDFKQAWRESFDEELTDDVARAEAERLLTFTNLLVESRFEDKDGVASGLPLPIPNRYNAKQ